MKLISTFLILILVAAPVFAATENLDELASRRARMATAPWGYNYLENAADNYTWNPETMVYTDSTTNSEVWRFTQTPSYKNYTQDIGLTHWSANGNRVMFHSYRPSNAFSYADGSNGIFMLSNTDGSKLKPAKNAASQLINQDKYYMWSPILADVLYQGGSDGTDGQSAAGNILYKVVVSDTTLNKSAYLTLPGTITRINAKKGISGDGRKAVIGATGNLMFPLTLYPEASKSIDSANGYSNVLNLDTYWGGTTGWTGYHDQYMSGAVDGVDGVWNYLMPETDASDGPWWRARVTGTGANSAPTHTQDRTSPYSWGGEIEPVITYTKNQNKADPWVDDGDVNTNSHYPSHFVVDRWGRYINNTKSAQAPYGVNVWDTRTHNDVITFTGVQWSEHHDWSAFSDWLLASASNTSTIYNTGMRLVLQNYKNADSQKTLAYVHQDEHSGTTSTFPYESYARPTQSPDGTKAMFHSSFLNSSDEGVQLYWAVAYYPYPPEIKSAAKNGGNVQLTWDFNQGTAGSPNLTNPRTYATRGWPNETTDRSPSPREIKQFRVWVSTDNSTWSPIGTANYNNCSGTNECGMWTETAWTYDATQANGTTRYYAVTSLEHSGLESRTLSNTWKVILDGSGNVSSQVQQSNYPEDPGGKSVFYTTQPDAPTGITKTHKKSPATADGQYTVEWTAPANKTLIRHYNIYAKDGSAPTAVQQNRVASVPAAAADTAFSYVDWLGNTDGSTQYLVTSVDYLGNEAGAATSDTTPPSTSPSKSGRFQSSQLVTLTANETATTLYCRSSSTNCTPATSYTAPVKVLVNRSYEKLCYKSTDTAANGEMAKCTEFRKQRRR